MNYILNICMHFKIFFFYYSILNNVFTRLKNNTSSSKSARGCLYY